MKCFYHPAIDAVALCKSCLRGICRECAVDQGRGLACKGKCESEVAAILDLQQRNKTAYQKASGSYMRLAAFMAFFGLAVSAMGILSWSHGQGFVLVLLGLFLLLFATLLFISGQKYKNPN